MQKANPILQVTLQRTAGYQRAVIGRATAVEGTIRQNQGERTVLKAIQGANEQHRIENEYLHVNIEATGADLDANRNTTEQHQKESDHLNANMAITAADCNIIRGASDHERLESAHLNANMETIVTDSLKNSNADGAFENLEERMENTLLEIGKIRSGQSRIITINDLMITSIEDVCINCFSKVAI